MEHVRSFFEVVKPWIGWGIIIYLVIVIFGLSQDYPANFVTTTTIFILLFAVHHLNGKINDLEKEVELKDKIIIELRAQEVKRALGK